MAKISTKDLILEVALVLLNERGESNVTSVDLANEMNISPGNLYYHFKGKEQVVEELYAQYHARVLVSLQEITKQANGDAKATLASLAVVSDVLQQFRFISQDMLGINERYPSLRESLAKLMSLLMQTVTSLVRLVMDASKVTDSSQASKMLAANLIYTLISYGAYDGMLKEHGAQATIEEHLYLHFLPFL